MFSHMLDPTVIATMSLGALLSVLLQGIYLWRFRSQVIVPFRLTYSLPRKLVSSYTLGLTYAAIFGLLQLLRIIPFVGALAPLGGAALIGFNTVVAYRYHRWQFMRQEANQSLHPVEWGVMLIVFGFFGFAVAIGIAIFLNGSFVVKYGMEKLVTLSLIGYFIVSVLYIVIFYNTPTPHIY